MKKYILAFFLSAFTLAAFGQEYLYGNNPHETTNLILKKPEEGFRLCQFDQNILYDKALDSSQERLSYLLETIDDERHVSATSFRLKRYNSLLAQSLVKHILLVQMKQQLAKKSLYRRYQAANQANGGLFLGMDQVKVDLSEELSRTIRNVVTLNSLAVASVDHIENELLKEVLSELVEGSFEYLISRQASKTMAAILAGTVTKEVFKKTMISSGISLSKKMLVSVGRGTLIDLLTYPLYGYSMSDEDQWLGVLEKAPILMLNPDWKVEQDKKGSIGIDTSRAWRTHCLAMLRKPKRVESRFNMMEENEKKEFFEQIRTIRQLPEYSKRKAMNWSPVKKDGTFVAPKRKPLF